MMLLALLIACSGKTDDALTDSGTDVCTDAPVVTWENFGNGFVIENCQPCHASTSTNRNDAPEEVFFDAYDDTIGWKDRIIVRSTGDEPSMPPKGGVNDDDRTRLEIWLTCWE